MYTVIKILYFIRSRRMILTKESYAGNRKKRFLFYGLMILCAFIVVILQFFGPGKYSERISKSQILYQGDFVWQKSDGSSEAIQVPGKYKVPARDTMTIVTQLPDDYTESTLMIRSSLQSIVFMWEENCVRGMILRILGLSARTRQAVMCSVRHLQQMQARKFVLN